MSATASLVQCADRFAGGEPVLVGSTESEGTAFVALPAADVRPAGLRKLGELAGDMVLLAVDDRVADRIRLAAPTPIDAAACADGGWSLADRALTMRMAAAPDTSRRDLSVPGHVLTLLAGAGAGAGAGEATEGPAAAVELAHAIGLPGAVALAAVHDRAGTAVSLAAARRDLRLRALAVAPLEELRRRILKRTLDREAVECSLPTRAGAFRAVAFASDTDGTMTVALLHGDVTRSAPLPVPVHEHVHCLLGDTFSSSLCPCRASLDAAIDAILRAGAGVILYTKGSLADPFSCARGQGTVDRSMASGLLARAGVRKTVTV